MMDAAQMAITANLVGRTVDEANVTQLRLEAVVREQMEKIRQLQIQLAGAQLENMVYQMGVAALSQQAKVVKAELLKVQPKHPLFNKTGKKYPDGSAQTVLNSVYDAAFDAKGVALGAPKPGYVYRDLAK